MMVDGIERIKFVTNYPKDMTRATCWTTIRDLPKVSPYLHVPAQSGSDEVLKRMKRGYTIADYMEMFERIERILPEAAVSSDFIVGFCGETEDDFQKIGRAGRALPVQEQFHLSVQRSPGHQGVPSDCRTTCRVKSKLAATTNCWPFKTRLPKKTT